jgi:hypothetical protein
MRAGVIVGAVVALSTVLPASAEELIAEIPAAASATGVAHRSFLGTDLLSVSQSNTMSAAKIALAKQSAAAVGASATEISGYSIGMSWVTRGDTFVQYYAAPGLWQYPMSTTIVPLAALPSLMGSDVAAAVSRGQIAMGATTAGMRGARAGDTIGLVAADGSIVPFTIGVVAADEWVGGTEIVMSPEQAALLGATQVSSVLIYGSFSRFALESALASRGLVDGTDVRIRRSWDLPNPDSVLGMVRTKQALGEFAYMLNDTDDGISIEAQWVANRLPAGRELYAGVEVRARCHNAIRADLQAALIEVAQSGLAGAIDLDNTNTYGGCYNPRFNRLTGDLGFLSRHAWAQAIDMNTSANAQGKPPTMDCRVVRIFRKHGFAWGGNFLTPDGMHFEWVGQRRDLLQYPSEYCPNLPGGVVQSFDDDGTVPAAVDRRGTFFDGSDGLLSLDPA